MLPVAAERQPRVERLPIPAPGAVVGKVRYLPRPRVHHCQGLLVLRLERTIARIHRHDVAPIRRHGHRHRSEFSRWGSPGTAPSCLLEGKSIRADSPFAAFCCAQPPGVATHKITNTNARKDKSTYEFLSVEPVIPHLAQRSEEHTSE